jgi:hypothetical protein
VIIVAEATYKLAELALTNKCVDLYSLKASKADRVETILGKQFTAKNKDGNYGVYLLSEAQGRGTDMPTNGDIEANGGNFVTMLDVLSFRS